jgi:alkanesulfonate monooxygenase SsuD/methylene tetrahydromethanopterin reductase-like flavin-dependent oxidoreductase (luciferase family)
MSPKEASKMNPVFGAGSISFRPYPHNELPAEGIIDTLLGQVKRAERVGFDGIMFAEHHGGFGGYLCNPQQFTSWVLDGTKTMWAASCPMLLPLRPTALTIEETAWMAARYPGRVGLGVGAGSLELDFQIMEQPFPGFVKRFNEALPIVTRALAGKDPGLMGKDPAMIRLAQHPVPVLSATGTPAGCRRAAEAGAGLIFGSSSPAAHYRSLISAYRDAGGTGPKLVIVRVWVGDRSAIKKRQTDLLAMYRSYAKPEAMSSWQEDPYINGTPMEVAEQLLTLQHEAGTDAMNIRVHVPGAKPEEIDEQIDALGEVVGIMRRNSRPAAKSA